MTKRLTTQPEDCLKRLSIMDNFTAIEIQTGEITIFLRSYGEVPPILLLHGFPQTHRMWRSGCPASDPAAT